MDVFNDFLGNYISQESIEKIGIDLNLAIFLFILFWSVFTLIIILRQFKEHLDHTAMGIHRGGITEFRKKSFAEKNLRYCEYLRKKYNDANKDENGNLLTFTPIEMRANSAKCVHYSSSQIMHIIPEVSLFQMLAIRLLNYRDFI